MTTWHQSVEGSPDDAPIDESQAAVVEEARRLESLIEEDERKWLNTLQLTNPIPSVFLEEYREAQGQNEEAA